MKYDRLICASLLTFLLLGLLQNNLVAQSGQEMLGLPLMLDFTPDADPIVKADPIPGEKLTDSLPEIELVQPKPLEVQPLSTPDPLIELRPLISKQVVKDVPYLPFIQEISLKVACISLLKNVGHLLSNLKEKQKNNAYEYQGGVNILFRKNIQLVTDVGYAVLYPPKLQSNQHAYSARGPFFSIGLDYLSRYSETNNVLIGLRVGYAQFRNSTLLPDKSESTLHGNLTASWIALAIGAETRLIKRSNLYGGCALSLGYLSHFSSFSPATDYVVPGFGSNTNRLNVSLDLYLMYKISFLEKMIRLK